MKRNVILIHLESLNNFIYKMNPKFFPKLRMIERKSILFEKYFSTATSTLMTLADIYYGGMEQYEQCTSLAYVPKEYHYDTSLFDELKMQGYKTGLFVYPDGNDRDTAEDRHIAGFNNEMVLISDYEKYLLNIEKMVTQQPFALSLCNYISNLYYNIYARKKKTSNGRESWEEGFRSLDSFVGDVFEILERKGVLKNTTVILYGDHGDDYWCHGANGRTHPVETYTHLIHTPMMIYDERYEPELNQELVSSVDLRQIINGLLAKNSRFQVPKHEVVVARSLYSAQPVSFLSMRKSYSVTDGKLLLMVSMNGLEMYDIELDPLCTNNLLYLWKLKDGCLVWNEEHFKRCSYQYRHVIDGGFRRYLRQRFYMLKKQLYEETKKLFLAAKLTEDKMIEEMKFDGIRYVNGIEEE